MSEDRADARVHAEVAGWALGALGSHESAEFPGHLRDCAGCAAELERLRPVRRLLDTAAPAAELPTDLQARTLGAVQRAAAARQRRRRTSWLASAAAGIVFLAGLAVVHFRPQPGTSVHIRLAPIRTAAGGLGGSATGQATAHETANGWSVQLSVHGLKDLREQGFYECWYSRPDDGPGHLDRVSAGTFEVKPDGSAQVSMSTWADPREFSIMKITREQANGKPAQTGPVVLKGPVRV